MARMAGDSSSKAFGKVAKKKQNVEMYDALESTINRVTDQAQKFRRKMDELVSSSLGPRFKTIIHRTL